MHGISPCHQTPEPYRCIAPSITTWGADHGRVDWRGVHASAKTLWLSKWNYIVSTSALAEDTGSTLSLFVEESHLEVAQVKAVVQRLVFGDRVRRLVHPLFHAACQRRDESQVAAGALRLPLHPQGLGILQWSECSRVPQGQLCCSTHARTRAKMHPIAVLQTRLSCMVK